MDAGLLILLFLVVELGVIVLGLLWLSGHSPMDDIYT